jgi:UDP-N-acetylmuramyl pentapeptide phosphotransferase/UDP-N-acetylglucosamine-1-phosphate transferase
MNDEWTKENQIKKQTLKAQVLMPYMMGISIFSVLVVFIISNSTANLFEKNILLSCLITGLAIMLYLLKNNYKEIDRIFKT